jgi:hypothetical protein
MTDGTDVPPAAPTPPGPGRGSRRPAVLAVLALLAIAGAAVGFYFVGRSSADTAGARAEGRRQGEARFAPGTARYRQIYTRGFDAGRTAGVREGRVEGRRQGAEAGRKLGLDKGRQIGKLQGQRQGIVSGAKAALGGFTDWQTGAFYLVRFAAGAQGVPFRIDSRKLMASNRRYAICANDPAAVCTQPIGG